MNKYLIILCIIFLPLVVWGQSSQAKRALENLQDGNHEKARELLEKAFRKDEFDPFTAFVWSKLYNDDLYVGSNIDSAYYYILYARSKFTQLDEKSIEKMSKAGIDSFVLEKQKTSIDKKAFELIKKQNSVEAYTVFIKKFPTSSDIPEAIELREKAAYNQALKSNTEESFQKFIDSFPEAPQVPEAKKRYEQLFFERNTQSGKLDDLIDYLKQKPDSEFRQDVEIQILKLKLVGNQLEDFQELRTLIQSPKAMSILKNLYFHWFFSEFPDGFIEDQWLDDSLRLIMNQNKTAMLPILTESGFNYVNASGQLMFNKNFEQIDRYSLCDFASKDLFVIVEEGKSTLINNLDQVVFEGNFESYEDLGYGILSIKKDNKFAALHKSGNQITPFIYDEIGTVGSFFIKVRKESKWGLITYLGEQVLNNEFEEITAIGENIMIGNGERYAITSLRELRKALKGEKPTLVFIYDEFEPWPQNRIWVRSGEAEGLIGSDSGFAIKLNEQQIDLLYNGFVVVTPEEKYYLNDKIEVLLSSFEEIEVSPTFVAVKTTDGFKLSHPESEQLIQADSVKLWGSYFALIYNGNISYIAVPEKEFDLSSGFRLSLVKGLDNIEYLLINQDRKTYLMDRFGDIIIEDTGFSARALGPEYIVVKKGDKDFLFNSKGQKLLNSDFDLISGYENGGVSLMNKGKLGYYHFKESIYVPAKYSQRIRRGLEGELILNEDGAFYIFDPAHNLESEERFDEVQVWNQSKYLVLQDGHYFFFNLKSGFGEEIIFEEISPLEKSGFFKIRNSRGSGIIHSEKGIIIPSEYTFVNFRNHFFIAVKYLSSAEYYVKSYFDLEGNRIWTGGLTAEQYDELYCEQ